MRTDVELVDFRSESRDGIVEATVLLPPGFAPGRDFPLLISLHGGSRDRHQLAEQVEMYDQLFATGVLPPAVVVSFSAGAVSWFLGWETFVVEELPALVEDHYDVVVDRKKIALTGISMGGSGTLMIGLENPERFCCIAAMAPAVEASTDLGPRGTRASWWRTQEALESLWGAPVDVEQWLRDNPASIVQRNADRIRTSGVEIYLEAGDRDCMMLQDGAEFLHRLLWDHDIRHEYHLVRWADHVGESIAARYRELHDFIGAAFTGRRVEPNDLPLTNDEQRLLDWFVGGGLEAGEPQPVTVAADDSRAATMMTRMMAALREAVDDPDMARAYARLEMPRG